MLTFLLIAVPYFGLSLLVSFYADRKGYQAQIAYWFFLYSVLATPLVGFLTVYLLSKVRRPKMFFIPIDE